MTCLLVLCMLGPWRGPLEFLARSTMIKQLETQESDGTSYVPE